MATNIDKFVEPSEIPGGSGVPIGGILMWMNPGAAATNPTPPIGFEYCDGTAVVTGGSPLLGEIKPNLMISSGGGVKGVARGADVTGAPYGVGTPLIVGGADTHSHAAATGLFNTSHSHTMAHDHDLSAHTHGTFSGGTHGHGFTDTARTAGAPATGALFAGGGFAHDHDIPAGSGSHAHGSTGTPSPDLSGASSAPNTGPNGANHSHTIASDGNLPTFTEVAFIVRVI